MDYRKAAEVVDIDPAQLKAWLVEGSFRCTSAARVYMYDARGLRTQEAWRFNDGDIRRLEQFVKARARIEAATVAKTAKPAIEAKPASRPGPFKDDGRAFLTVGEIASLWNLSKDTVRRVFEGEAGIIAIAKGKRKRVTLRIPRAVFDRVQRSRSNP